MQKQQFCQYGHDWETTTDYEISRYVCADCGITELEYIDLATITRGDN